MASVLAPEIPAPGFSFENCQRNAFLANKGFPAPKATKTGTTIVGIIYADGVILGADTRATEGTVVSDKNCEKIHYLAGNMYCCGAGTAADTEMTTQSVSSQLELQRLHTGRTVPVETAATLLKRMLFRYQGHIGAALVLGGVDRTGPHIYCIYPHGSVDKLPYATMGSGSLAAMAVFESGWRKDLSEEEGKKLVRDAIAAGIFNDLGSGSNVDLCVIRNSGPAQYLRTFEEANVKVLIFLNLFVILVLYLNIKSKYSSLWSIMKPLKFKSYRLVIWQIGFSLVTAIVVKIPAVGLFCMWMLWYHSTSNF